MKARYLVGLVFCVLLVSFVVPGCGKHRQAEPQEASAGETPVTADQELPGTTPSRNTAVSITQNTTSTSTIVDQHQTFVSQVGPATQVTSTDPTTVVLENRSGATTTYVNRVGPPLVIQPGVPGRTVSATPLVRYSPVKGCKVRIEGTSTVHEWQVEGSLIGGALELGEGFPTEPNQFVQPGLIMARAEAFIPVRSLKSVEKDGKPYSDKMDDMLHEKLLLSAHPRITYSLAKLTLKEPPKTAFEPYLCDATGDLVVAGVTNRLSFPVRILPLGEDRLKLTGGTSVRMTDFGIEPPSPKLLLGMIKTGDEVELSFEWLVARKVDTSAAVSR